MEESRTTQNVLTTNNLIKKYGEHTAVDSVNMSVCEGEIYGLVGRNGAGKTSFMKMIVGLSNPTSGSFCLFDGEKSGRSNREMYSQVGNLIETPGLFPNMTAYDNLMLKAHCANIHDKRKHIGELLELVDLTKAGNKKVKQYSLGMKQRLGVAMALIGYPKLLVLDEPINGLDPQGIAEMREIILKLSKEYNITVIISSHILEELSKLATAFGILDNGKLIYENTAQALKEECEAGKMSLEEFYFQITKGAKNV